MLRCQRRGQNFHHTRTQLLARPEPQQHSSWQTPKCEETLALTLTTQQLRPTRPRLLRPTEVRLRPPCRPDTEDAPDEIPSKARAHPRQQTNGIPNPGIEPTKVLTQNQICHPNRTPPSHSRPDGGRQCTLYSARPGGFTQPRHQIRAMALRAGHGRGTEPSSQPERENPH